MDGEIAQQLRDLDLRVRTQELALRAAIRSLLKESPKSAKVLEKRYGLILNGYKRPPDAEQTRKMAETMIKGWLIWAEEEPT